MTINKNLMLEQYSQLLNQVGDYCDYGCTEDQVYEMMVLAKKLFPNKQRSIVSNWCWADIDIDGNDRYAIETMDLEPCFIFANKIIYDTQNRVDYEGYVVRSTLLEDFIHPCIFSTLHTSYILLGAGVRLKVSQDIYYEMLPNLSIEN